MIALSDAARWRIVLLIAERPRSVGVVAELTGLRQPEPAPKYSEIGRTLLGMAYHRASDPAAAWAEFERVNERELITAAAVEYYPTAIDALGAEALPLIEGSHDSGDTEQWSSKAVLRTAESAFCIDAFGHVRTLVEDRLSWDADKLDAAIAYELTRMLGSPAPRRKTSATTPDDHRKTQHRSAQL